MGATQPRRSSRRTRRFERILVLFGQGCYAQAEEQARALLAHDPEWAPAAKALGTVLGGTGRDLEAVPLLRRAVEAQPEDPELHNNLGNCLARLGYLEEAAYHLDRALALAPKRAALWSNRAQIHLKAGELAEAEAACRRALTIDPALLETQLILAQFVCPPLDSPLVAELKAVLDDTGRAPEMRARAGFVLGKIYLEAGEDASALAAYHQGNALTVPLRPTNHQDRAPVLAAAARKMTLAFFDQRRHLGLADCRQPVLILGMPRSGKSLCESLLRGHSAVYAGGESDALYQSLQADGQSAEIYRLTDTELAHAHARRALATLPGQHAERVILTLPGHVWMLGLIGLLFPAAPLVFCYREPLDLGLSAYFKHFRTGHGYAYALEKLGREIRLTEAMMDHWQRVLPNPMLRIDYETLVQEPEQTARRLCAHIGLPWEDACLDGLRQEVPYSFALGPADSLDLALPMRTDFIGVSRRFAQALMPLKTAYEKTGQELLALTEPQRVSIRAVMEQATRALEQHNPYAAVNIAGRALLALPEHPGLRRLHAIACSLIGRDTMAVELLQGLLHEQPEDVGLWVNLIRAHLRAGALDAADRLLEHPPKKQVATQIVRQLQVESAVAAQTRNSQTFALAEAGLQDHPGDPEWISLTAALCPEPKRAKQLHQDALARAPNSVRWLRYAQVLEGSERRDALWQAASCKPLSREAYSAWQQLTDCLTEVNPPLGRLHHRLADIWARYDEDALEHSFGDFGLPYQSLEAIDLPGTRPTGERLRAYQLAKHLPPGARALDIGCNHGFLLLGLAEQLASAVGFDISRTCIEVGQEVADYLGAGHIQLQPQTFDEFLANPCEPFDLVIACAVHRWIGMPLEQFGQTLTGLTRPGGLVLIESQGRRDPAKIEEDFPEKLQVVIRTGFEVVHHGSICDDGINKRGYALLKRRD